MVLSAPREVCIERARSYTRSFRETEGEHPAIRAAKAFRRALAEMTTYILPEEQVVGNRTSKLVATVLPVERGDINAILDLDLDVLCAREDAPLHITEADRAELKGEILPYWRGRTLRDRRKKLMKEAGIHFHPAVFSPLYLRHLKTTNLARFAKGVFRSRPGPRYLLRGFRELLWNNPALVTNVFDVQGHLVLGHANILREGFSGVRARAAARLREIDGDADGRAFLSAVITCCDAMRDFALRFARKADEEAARTDNSKRKAEFDRIATACRHVPWNPPRTFFEAVQSIWLTQVGGCVAYGMAGLLAPGRVDQYLYPFYKADLQAGEITPDEALELLEELLLKFSYNLLIIPALGKQTGSELGADSCVIAVGGVDESGNDAVNDCTHLMIEAFENVKATANGFAIRLSARNPPAYWTRALATYRKTSGSALLNDEKVVESLVGCGYSAADARNYGIIGCVEAAGDRDTFGCTSGNDVSLCAALEMALLDGRLRCMGRRIGPRTGEPRAFRSFGELMEAFKAQVSFLVGMIAHAVNLKDRAYAEAFPIPYVSLTLAGCIENARDATRGGAKYNFGSVVARGLGTAADSLAAIEHFVFAARTVPMDRLLSALDSNFQGYEDLRLMLATRGPKYGDDDARADAIAREIVTHFCAEVSGRRTTRAGPFRPGFFSYGMHVIDGLHLGASANGRRAGEPVSNSFSPSNGAERHGPTAVLSSVSKMPAAMISNGYALNMKLLPSFFETEEDLQKMVALVRGFFAKGGMEVQPNVVSSKVLRDAQVWPELYRDLVVRVSGYSAYFCDLGRPLQDEIISRTEFGCVA
jgi:formate C-acetyltransferase